MKYLAIVRRLGSYSVTLNAMFLIANTFIGSLLGFVFWTVSSHLLSPEQIGLGAAYISAITLVSTLGDMGLGVLIVRLAPLLTGKRLVSFINTSILTVLVSTAALTFVFAAGIPLWAPELRSMTYPPSHLAIFAIAALAFALAQFVDRIYIAFQVTQWLFSRNLLMHLCRLVLIVTVGALWKEVGLVGAVGGSALITLGLSLWVFMPRAVSGYNVRLNADWTLIADKMGYTLGNHVAQLLWGMPMLIYPLLVVNILGAEANAQFYTSWMIANLLYVVPVATSTSAFAHAAKESTVDLQAFWRAMRYTLLGLIPLVAALMALAEPTLLLFGKHYALQSGLLVLLLISVFPYTINSFVVTAYRLTYNVRSLIWVSGSIAGLSLVLVAVLARRWHLWGVGIGWMVAQSVGVLIAWLSYRNDATRKNASSGLTSGLQHREGPVSEEPDLELAHE